MGKIGLLFCSTIQRIFMSLSLDLGLNFILPGSNIFSLPKQFRSYSLDGKAPWHKELAARGGYDVQALHGHWYQKAFQ